MCDPNQIVEKKTEKKNIKIFYDFTFKGLNDENYKDIVEISLIYDNLNEEMLKNLHKFSSLRVFQFRPSEINLISDNFQNLTSLEEIYIRVPINEHENQAEKNNDISWHFLLKIQNLKKITYHSFKNCEDLLSLFTKVTTLQSLDIKYNKITNFPKEIINWSLLRQLRMTNCKLSDLPNELFDLINLEYIDASENNLSIIQDGIGNLTNLVELNFSQNQLTHVSSKLNNLNKLKTLSLSSNKLTKFIKKIGNMTALRKITLSHNNIKYLPDDIGKLTGLSALYIVNNNILRLPYSFRKISYTCLLCVHNYQPFLDHLPNNFKFLNIAINDDVKINDFPKNFKKLFLHFKGDYKPVKKTIKNINLPTNMIAKKYSEFLWCFFFDNEPQDIDNFIYHNMCD